MTNLRNRYFEMCLVLFIGIYLVSIAGISFAVDIQSFRVKDNATILAVISERELSRIVFEQDKINQIFVTTGEINYEVADQNLYIKPRINKLINFFVSTTAGNTYKFIVTPKDIPATQILLHRTPASIHKNNSDIAQQNRQRSVITGDGVLNQQLSKAVSVIIADDRTVGYKVKEIGKTLRTSNCIKMVLDSTWNNAEVLARKYYLTNKSKDEIFLKKHDYLSSEIQAVYIDNEQLMPGESTVLITVEVIR